MPKREISKDNPILVVKPYVNEKAIQNVIEVLRSGWIGEGPKVREFENKLSEKFKINYLAALHSGTAALHLALHVGGIKPGDEVITTAQTCTATNHAILMERAKPVFADIRYEDVNIDPDSISRKITPRTKAIICVHWAGYPCNLDEINKIARENNLFVIEDAAHALGATYKGESIGNISDFTTFSFQAIKQLTTADGGMLASKHPPHIEKVKLKRWFSIPRNNKEETICCEPLYDIKEVGFKYQMNDVAAAIGLGNLEDFDHFKKHRSEIVKLYREELENIPGITLLENNQDRTSGNWLFSMHVKNREKFAAKLKQNHINTSVVHLRNDKFTAFGPLRNDLPQTEKAYHTLISLPLHNHLTEHEVQHVISIIKQGW
ncbi:MAG: DegT/DnrJ/EryC1/StrS family aminotransferase [Nanoarchaeota archaeon]|nr:DegT/DnrJ/EryC1/StrS family aminotransferase [Nanoarchaeota archaeon]